MVRGRRSERLAGLAVAGLVAATATWAQQVVPVASGQHVELSEVLIDDTLGETWVRFRFVAPQIAREGGDIGYDTAIRDIEALCRTLILPYLDNHGLAPAKVVVSMSDRDVPFGAANPDATQFFEAYRPSGADCIWEEF